MIRENPRGRIDKVLSLVLLPEPSPRLLTGGAYAKNLPPAGFLNAAALRGLTSGYVSINQTAAPTAPPDMPDNTSKFAPGSASPK